MTEKYQYQPELTAVALGYSNKKFISDLIFPKVTVTTQSFEYNVIDGANPPKVPTTKVGQKGSANVYEGSIKQLSATCENHALKEGLAKTEIENNQAKGINLASIRTLQLLEVLKASREIALANKLSDSNNYLNANVKTLTANEKIGSATSEAVDIIEEYKNKVLGGANTMIISKAAFSKLRRDRSIVNSVSINSKASQTDIPAMVSPEAIKDLFMLDNLFVGETLIDTAKKGQTPTLASAWNNDIILLNINPSATVDFGVTYGFSAVYQDWEVYTYEEEDLGLKGGTIIRPSASFIDLVVGKPCGALLKAVI